jgi:hypothetical protein
MDGLGRQASGRLLCVALVAVLFVGCGDRHDDEASRAGSSEATRRATTPGTSSSSTEDFRRKADAICARYEAQIKEALQVGVAGTLETQRRSGSAGAVSPEEAWRRNVASVAATTSATRKIRAGLAGVTPPPQLADQFGDYLDLIDRMLALNQRGLHLAKQGSRRAAGAAGDLWIKSGHLARRFSALRLRLGLERC